MQVLPTGEIGATPWSLSPLWLGLLAVGVPALIWLCCAWWHVLVNDPHRLRRKGMKELRRVLRSVRRSHGLPEPQHLHAWLRASARAWGVRVSAPTLDDVRRAMVSLTRDSGISSRWCELWQLTERKLFAAHSPPMQDWIEQATLAAATVPIPRREQRFPNRRAHWFPSIAALTLLVSVAVVPPSFSGQADAGAISDAAAFRKAHDVSRQALEESWNDWAAHYNLAGFHMLEGRWDLAAAHATAAFLQHPSAETREALRAILDQIEDPHPRLRRLLHGAWYQRVPALLSVAGWQRMSLAAALVIAAGLTATVLALYIPAHRRMLALGGRSVASFGALLFIAAVSSWGAYGTMSEPEAAILLQRVNVRPAPTDLVPEAESAPAPAGSIVTLGRSFLGWRQVSVTENLSGWVRRGAVMPFYADQ